MQYLRVKGWEDFQHYKDRNPPWIKLHRTLLDDYEFSKLPDESKAHLMLIWLLASQLDGRVPAELGWLKAKIGAFKPPNLKLLIDYGFLIPEQHASEPLAERKQSASEPLATCKQAASEPLAFARSRETEAETEGEGAREALPTPEHRELALSLGLNAETEWASFADYCQAKGRRYKDRAAAFRNWLRQERKWAERDGRVPKAAAISRRID